MIDRLVCRVRGHVLECRGGIVACHRCSFVLEVCMGCPSGNVIRMRRRGIG